MFKTENTEGAWKAFPLCLGKQGGKFMQSNKVELNKVQVEEFKEYLYERENAEATIQKYLTDIRTFFVFWEMIW